jgi:hypothetical protein
MFKRLCINIIKKVVHDTNYKYLRLIFQNSSMHNLKTNFDKFISITNSFFIDIIDSHGNFQSYPKPPKMSDCEIIALSLTGESIGIDSENYFWKKLNSDYQIYFPRLIERSRFNRRRKRLSSYIQKLNQRIADILFLFLSVRLLEKKEVRFARKLLKMLLTKGFRQLVNLIIMVINCI